jgi:UDP-3-O-[3-hydroxymyristoyl] glucosamine N-acyltransferase
MQYSAKDIAALIQGQVVGDENRKVTKFSKIEEADSESICFFANEKYAIYLEETKAAILLVNNEFNLLYPKETTLIKCHNPYEAAAKLLEFYQTKISQQGIESQAFVHPSAKTGSNVYIAGFAYISENVSIGEDSKIFPHVFVGKNAVIGKNVIIHSGVKIYEECIVGDNCILHSGVVIGSDGFGFAPAVDGSYSKIPQIGNVILEENVEVGANTVIDRATMGSTRVMAGTKLDNLIQIAHNVVIGKNTVIAAQTGISGSTKIGNQVMIGGQVGIVGHIHIGDKSKINAQSGVSKSLDENSTVTGSPAWDYTKTLKAQSLFRKLPELFDRVLNLERKDK